MAENYNDINKRQAEFYNAPKSSKNFMTRIWSLIRNNTLQGLLKKMQIKEQVYEAHKNWFGDLSGKKVLDLGCFKGNHFSVYLAKNATEYHGIDLSKEGINELKGKLNKAGLNESMAYAIDFYSEDFAETGFDLIYAYSVLHHFQDVDKLIARLKEKLKPGGIIISYDPLETSLPVKLLRMLYRPFQSDKDWEWPFNRRTVKKFHNSFEVLERHGVLGRLKWGFVLNLLPVSKKWKDKKLVSWKQKDWERTATNLKECYGCLHLTMLMG